MCSICGGTKFDEKALKVFHLAEDRGRDYSNIFYKKNSWICNHRAIPTTEVASPEFNQPFGSDYKIVHNGVISNDKELGNENGMIDSYVLSKVLDFRTIKTLKETLKKVKGSYALAIMKPNGTFYLACNYKPIFYAMENGELYFSSYKEHLKDFENIKRVKPYSILDTETFEEVEIEREETDRALVICSGGLDSTAVASYVRSKHKEMILLHFQYGCIATSKELECIKKIAKKLNCEYYVMQLNYDFGSKSKLFGDSNDISKGIEGSEYAHEWVEARNLIMLSTAVGFAEANNYSHIYLGTNLEEGGAYPDNENQFIKDFNSCLYGAVQNGRKVEIHTPVGNLMKHEIVAFGNKYNAPFEDTWSCYKDGDKPCGECGPCFMRRTAFKRNGLNDPLGYPEKIENDEVK
mgnify:CR=1 FL=1